MPFMSRFRKPKKEEDVLEGIEEPLEEEENEGLLMTTSSESSGPAGESDSADLDPPASPDAQQGDEAALDQAGAPLAVADDELLAAAQGGAPASAPAVTSPPGADAIDPMEAPAAQETPADEDAFDPMEASAVQDAPEAAGIEVQRVSAEEEGSAGSDDDLLSAFRDSDVTVESHELTKGLEDIPMGELLTEARELRGYLPQAQADDGDGAA